MSLDESNLPIATAANGTGEQLVRNLPQPAPTLVATTKPAGDVAPKITMVDVFDLILEDETRIRPNEDHINLLVKDIEQRLRDRPEVHPIQNPLRVCRRENKNIVVSGGHRLHAARRILLRLVPVIYLEGDLDEAGLLIEQAKDNELHQAYTPLERARNILRVVELRGCTQAEAGRLLGIKSASEVTKLLKVLKDYPVDLHPLIGEGEGKVPVHTAYQLARLDDLAVITELTQKVCQGLLTRDLAEETVTGLLGGKRPKTKTKQIKFTFQGITFVIDETKCKDISAVLALVDGGVKKVEKLGLAISTLPSMFKSNS